MKQLRQYKNGEFTEKELDDFTRKIIRAKFRKEKKNKWTQQLEKDHGITRSEKKIIPEDRTIFGKYLIGIAASIVFIMVALFVLQKNPTSDGLVFADNYLQENKFPNATATKGGEDISSLELKMAEAYSKENFSEAIELGKQLVALDQTNSKNSFFLGLCYLYQEDLQNAQKYLSQFKEIKKTEFQEESRWFLALTYTKQKDFENAKLELEYIVNQQEWEFKQAEALLKYLNE